MFREVFLVALCLATGHGQPVSCTDKEHCADGYYCDKEAKSCRECLSCQDLKREPLMTDNTCITSIDKCGACFKGFMIDRLGDVTAPCVAVAEPVGTPDYVWWIIGVLGVVFLGLMIGIMVYISLNPGVFRFGGNCPSSMVSTNIMTAHRPSAPEGPPPYTVGDYTTVRSTESPCPLSPESGDFSDLPGEDGPFIKRTPAPRPPGPRESAANQAARVFKRPVYDREPASPEVPIAPEYNDNLHIHDESTTPSTWTADAPSADDTNANGNVSEAAGEASALGVAVEAPRGLSALLARERDTTLIEHAPAKRARTHSTSSSSSNSNRDERENNPGATNNQGNFSGTHHGAPCFVINNVVQINQNS